MGVGDIDGRVEPETAPHAQDATEQPTRQHHLNKGDVLDVPHVATLLGVGRNTIYALVAKNQIPHRRLGKAIRFSRSSVMSWLSSWSSRDAKEGQ